MKRTLANSTRYPMVFSLGITFVFVLCLVISAVLGNLWPGESTYGQPGAITGRLVSIVLLVAALSGLGWLRTAGLISPGGWKVWLWLIPALAYTVLASNYAMTGEFRLNLSGPAPAVPVILFILISACLEEIAFRGLVLRGMLGAWGASGRGLIFSILISSLLFCCIHLLDFLSGRPLLNVLLQSLEAFFLGVFLAVLVVKSRSIYPAVFFHFAVNLAAYLGFAGQGIEPTPSAWWMLSLALLPLAVIGIFLLRGRPGQSALQPTRRSDNHLS